MTGIGTALFACEASGFNKTSRRHASCKLRAFAQLTTAPAVVVQSEGRSYADIHGEGLRGDAAALTESLVIRHVALLRHLDRGLITPEVFYAPYTRTVRSRVGQGSDGVFDDWRNVGRFPSVSSPSSRLHFAASMRTGGLSACRALCSGHPSELIDESAEAGRTTALRQ
jgi:hypothetical protein